MKFGFIFVLYKTPQAEVSRLKREVKNLNLIDYDLIFIDNTNKNRGYASGVNEGINNLIKKNIDVYVVGNPDISISSLTREKILNLTSKFDVGSFAMKQHNTNYYCGELDIHRLSSYLKTSGNTSGYSNCTYITGSLIFINSKVINTIGFFDENYFMYYEDVDFCMRAKRNNFKIGIDCNTIYTHYEVSTKNPFKETQIFLSWIKFFKKYSNPYQKFRELIRLPITILENKNVLYSLLYKDLVDKSSRR